MADGGTSLFELFTIIGSVAVGAATVVAVFYGGLNSIRREFWKGIDRVTSNQSKHDLKDERRFGIVDQALMEMTYRNNIRDGVKPVKRQPIREIVEDMERRDRDNDNSDDSNGR